MIATCMGWDPQVSLTGDQGQTSAGANHHEGKVTPTASSQLDLVRQAHKQKGKLGVGITVN